MAGQTTQFSIPRYSDRDLHERVLKGAGENGVSSFQHTLLFGTQLTSSTDDKEQLEQVFAEETIALWRLNFDLANGVKVAVEREADASSNSRSLRGYQDKVTITPRDQQPVEAIHSLKRMREALEAVDEKDYVEYLGDKDQAFYQAREQSVRDLQGMQEQFFKQLQSFTVEQTKGYQTRLDELEEKAAATEAKRDEAHTARLAEVDKREGELADREKLLDDRDNTTTRRSLLKEIQTILQERADKFELTKATRNRRWPALLGFLLLIGLLGGATGFFIYWDFTANKTGNLSAWLIVRQIVFGIAFATTAGFFLKWMSQWASRHAEEEFALKQLELDIIRASWVAEHALEWAESKHEEIPEDLIERLSRNLFTERNQEGEQRTAAEIVANALLGSASSAKLKLGENEVMLDRKGIAKMKRKGTVQGE